MGFKCSIDYTIAFSKGLFFFSHKECHSLSGISEEVHITAKFQKLNLTNMLAAELVLSVLHLFI